MAQVRILKIDSDGVPVEHTPASDEITFVSGQFGNVLASGNAIVSTDTDGNLSLVPNGTGDLVLDGVNWPQADGSANQVLVTNGSGQTSWANNFASQVFNIYLADEALLANDAVYISAADQVSKASATAGGAASRMIGFAAAATADTDPVNVVSEGVLAGFSGLTPGARYYLSTTAGQITSSIPVGTGNTVVQCGYSATASKLHIHIEQLGRRS